MYVTLNISVARKEIADGLASIFPDDREILSAVCAQDGGLPFGYTHPDILADFLGIEGNTRRAFRHIRCGYVCMTSYYYLLDAVMDDHLANPRHLPYLTHLLSGAGYFYNRAVRRLNAKMEPTVHHLMCQYLSRNARAANQNMVICADPFAEDTPFHIVVGRLNSFLFLYEYLLRVYGLEPHGETLSTLEQFAWYLQLSDDLADWREDYRARNWNPILRQCFRDHQRELSEEELESEFYLSGRYEQTLAQTIRGFEAVLAELGASPFGKAGDRLHAWIQSNIDRLKWLLEEFVGLKLAAMENGALQGSG